MIDSELPGNRRDMRRLLVLLLCLPALALANPAEVKEAASGPKLELEVTAGAASRNDLAPTVSARVGLDLWNWFTPSVRVFSVAPWAGPESAWAIQGELRAHTRGTLFQLTGGLGLGLATATVVRGSTGLEAGLTRSAQPWLTGDLGVRALLGPFFIGLSVGGAPFQQQWLGSLNLGVIAFGG